MSKFTEGQVVQFTNSEGEERTGEISQLCVSVPSYEIWNSDGKFIVKEDQIVGVMMRLGDGAEPCDKMSKEGCAVPMPGTKWYADMTAIENEMNRPFRSAKVSIYYKDKFDQKFQIAEVCGSNLIITKASARAIAALPDLLNAAYELILNRLVTLWEKEWDESYMAHHRKLREALCKAGFKV